MSKLIPKSGAWVHIIGDIRTVTPVHQFAIYYATPTGVRFYEGENTDNGFSKMTSGYHPSTGNKFRELLLGFHTHELLKHSIANWKRNKKHDFAYRQRYILETTEQETGPIHDEFPIEDQVEIITEHGPVIIQPHEYSIASKDTVNYYIETSSTGHSIIKYLSDNVQLKGKIAEQVFYLRSRGIKYVDALNMCIGSVKSKNLMYIYSHPAYVESFNRNFVSYVKHRIDFLNEVDDSVNANKYLELVNQIDGYETFS